MLEFLGWLGIGFLTVVVATLSVVIISAAYVGVRDGIKDDRRTPCPTREDS